MLTAADIMTREVVTVPPEMPVSEVAQILARERFGAVPVVDTGGTVLGIVTEEEMVARAAAFHLPRHIVFLGSVIYLEHPQRFEEEAARILALTAEQIMDHALPAVAPTTPVPEVAARLLNDDLRRVLVMENGRLAGLITRADIVRLQERRSDA
jgi:CBS domain-containing protein